ncbi:MAG TPA: hypothetical protein ENG47_01860 [Candidatus Aerophobetes bacterium]|uniref:Tetratricopeptide repeat protein n=1 Tax=Aerophobetes bacterium TaxID=2030807 RepID=A0A7V0N095_UNCAE|nr:hypothetical protein [Candidatus Aerophobetes bacterium]
MYYISPGFFVGVVAGGLFGFAIGFLLATLLKSGEGKEKEREKSRAERIFNQAISQKDRKRKAELLGKILEKYPNTTWADKALEEVIKMKKSEFKE